MNYPNFKVEDATVTGKDQNLVRLFGEKGPITKGDGSPAAKEFIKTTVYVDAASFSKMKRTESEKGPRIEGLIGATIENYSGFRTNVGDKEYEHVKQGKVIFPSGRSFDYKDPSAAAEQNQDTGSSAPGM